MHGPGLDYLELVFLTLLIAVAVLALVAKRLHVAYPIMLVLGGLVLSLIPHIPRVTMNPSVVFLVILPPLVFSAAFHTSWRDFRTNLTGIVMLAFGLVGFTIFGVAGTMHFLIPGFDWKLGLVLGSLIAATDAIAATATAKRLGLPRRITDLLEAESLVNDGSGLVALKFTLAMVVTSITPSVVVGAATLFYLVFGAVVVGLIAGVIVHRIQEQIDDAPVEITISLVTPYIAYLAAERLQCSGVLATLACGLYLGRRSSGFYSLHARIESSAVWRTLDFILNGLVFLVLGVAAALHSRRYQRGQHDQHYPRRRDLQPHSDCAALSLAVSGRVDFAPFAADAGAEGSQNENRRIVFGWMGGHAGRAGPRGGLVVTGAARQRDAFSVPQRDHLSDILRNLRDVGDAGIKYAGADSDAGARFERYWLRRREHGTAADDLGGFAGTGQNS